MTPASKKIVLIIEDDADTADLLTIFLEKKQYKVAATGNGLEGLTMIKFLKPDIIIVDLMIPGMDGKALIGKIREDVYMTKKMVVVISGMFTKKYSGEKSDELGADAVFSKPIELKKLHRTIQNFF
jgi:DNA-binding response OmpR family regulator